MFRRNLPTATALSLLLCFSLAACTAAPKLPANTADADSPASEPGHGYVEGASELAEPAVQLVTSDPSGRTSLLDLASEQRSQLGELGPTDAMTSDGRFVFASSASDGTVAIVDSGTWTVDHEDHFHYYRATPRTVGTVQGNGLGVVHSNSSLTLVSFVESGTAVVLDSADLARGTVSELRTLGPDLIADAAVPLGHHVLAPVAAAGTAADTVHAFDADGSLIASADCTALDGSITSKVGVVFGCADGAILATESADGVVFERIPYPQQVSEGDRARDFRSRAGRPVVSAPAGELGAWLLDTRARSWSLLASEEPLLQVVAVDDQEHNVVALTRSGRIAVFNAQSGAVLAHTEAILSASLSDERWSHAIELIIDANRAYIASPAEQRAYEIDFADQARIARSFDFETAPAFMAVTGR